MSKQNLTFATYMYMVWVAQGMATSYDEYWLFDGTLERGGNVLRDGIGDIRYAEFQEILQD